MSQGEKECLNSETTELKQKIRYLQDQLLPLSKQREYQEKEIQRLNRVSVEHLWNRKKQNNDPCLRAHVGFFSHQALEEALNLHSPSSSQQPPGQGNFADAANNLKKQELLTQIAVLKEQVRYCVDGTETFRPSVAIVGYTLHLYVQTSGQNI